MLTNQPTPSLFQLLKNTSIETVIFYRSLLIPLLLSLFFVFPVQATLINEAFINEIHYDNQGADTNEFIEIAGLAGTNLENWSLYFYRGSNGGVYKSYTFGAVTLTDQNNGFGFTSININSIYNGSPNGIALANSNNELVQFLSYEGVFTASNGIASGITSNDIGVSELGSTPLGFSLQLSGVGRFYQDFTWQAAQLNTQGFKNNQQVFTINNTNSLPNTSIPEPKTITLFVFIFLIVLKKHTFEREVF